MWTLAFWFCGGRRGQGNCILFYGHKVYMRSGGILFYALTSWKPESGCAWLNVSLPRCLNWIPRTSEYATWNGKRDSANVIKWLWILSWRDYLGLSRGPSVITRICIGGSQGSRSEEDMWQQEQELEGCGHKCQQPLDSKRIKEKFSPGSSRRNHTYWHLDVSLGRLTCDFWLPEL